MHGVIAGQFDLTQFIVGAATGAHNSIPLEANEMGLVAQDYRDAEFARPEVFPPAPARNPDATIRAVE